MLVAFDFILNALVDVVNFDGPRQFVVCEPNNPIISNSCEEKKDKTQIAGNEIILEKLMYNADKCNGKMHCEDFCSWTYVDWCD